MERLYRSALHRDHWIAYIPGSGWLIFPARENGWDERKPARGLDPVYLREVPVKMAVQTGFIEALNKPELLNVA